LDDGGIPADAAGRVAIARRILEEAAKYGIDKKDLVFDTLAMPVSASGQAANVALDALKQIREELGCHTSLGISNISFGLPGREAVNSAFFLRALDRGLSAAIINPYAKDMMRSYHAFRALAGLDENCADHIAYSEANPYVSANTAGSALPSGAEREGGGEADPLHTAIVKGFQEQAGQLAKEELKSVPPLELINTRIIPALNEVGDGFGAGKVYLPQLLMSAEAAGAAFDEIKAVLASSASGSAEKRGTVVVATVKGDIHDIGKNIARLLLESYGFDVADLGKDVEPEAILEAVTRLHAPIAGLSALMTTTVPAMEETIALLKEKAPWCRVLTGGAVLTADFAESIGSDCYAKDAMDTVHYAEKVVSGR
ncbi:MAG: cobalamin-dependent protein, partial [Firmicutes bacterium]|nr:cobalamin-dependent protein [Bacillota bacterium]